MQRFLTTQCKFKDLSSTWTFVVGERQGGGYGVDVEEEDDVLQQEQDDGCLVDVPDHVEIGILEPEVYYRSQVSEGEDVWFGVDVDEHKPEVEADDEGEQPEQGVYFEEGVAVGEIYQHVGLLVVLPSQLRQHFEEGIDLELAIDLDLFYNLPLFNEILSFIGMDKVVRIFQGSKFLDIFLFLALFQFGLEKGRFLHKDDDKFLDDVDDDHHIVEIDEPTEGLVFVDVEAKDEKDYLDYLGCGLVGWGVDVGEVEGGYYELAGVCENQAGSAEDGRIFPDLPFELVFEYSAVVYYAAHLYLPSQNLLLVLYHIPALHFVLEQLLFLCVFEHLFCDEVAVAGVVEHFS